MAEERAKEVIHAGMPAIVCLALTLTAAPSSSGSAETTTIAGMVGSHRATYRVRVIRSLAQFRVRAADAAYVAVTEVHAAPSAPIPYHYIVSGTGLPTYERRYAGRGLGPVTFFVQTDARSFRGDVTITNLTGADNPTHILAVRSVTASEVAAQRKRDRFGLMGTVVNPQLGLSEDEQASRLAARLPAVSAQKDARGFCYEIYYAAWDAKAVRTQLVKARAWSRRHGLKALLGLVSWWNGTPRRVPDGLGGAFDDVKYQQVCYTPGAEHPVNPELRELLGARYNRHYRLSVPNIWSNTPWLTMNSSVLNDYRARRIAEAIRLLKDVSSGDVSWVAGIFLENEPRYWDTQSTQGTPQWAGEQWADFNPMAVAQAARDGVTLEPADGMSRAELAWLQMNVGRYFQQTVDAANRALAVHGLRGRFPLYTHSLQIPILFPGCLTNQSPADWALARGARTGIEGIWSNLSDYDRLREWGPWCNLNREETDGLPIDTHLWDLRATYAAGGEFYNSYNWHTLKDDAYFAYARRFVDAPSVVRLPAIRARVTGPESMALTAPMGLQAFDSLSVPVEAGSSVREIALQVVGADGREWISQRMPVQSGARSTEFRFPAPAELSWAAEGTMRLRAYGVSGSEIPGSAAFAAGAAQSLHLSLNLSECRALSRIVIGRRQGAPRR